jgi:tRNA(Ile)-lysidine synthase
VSQNHTSHLQADFERALGAITARVFAMAESAGAGADAVAAAEMAERRSMAVAFSGGLDSSVLLQLASTYAQAHGISLHVFHIHHGLSPHADQWEAHCAAQAAALQLPFEARRIALAGRAESGVEEAARLGRYAALGELCRLHGVGLLLTAHHQDDQAETVLLQLLRGSGVAGLSGMDAFNHAPDLLGDAQLVMARPLLEVARSTLEAWAAGHGITHVEDESNADTRYARNALRHQVMPAIGALFPGFAQRFARTAQHAQSAQRLLVELAAQDLAACMIGATVDILRLKTLSSERIDNLLRYWFGVRGIRMPSTAWLAEMRSQLLEAKADAQLCVTHADCHIRRHRDRVYLTARTTIDPAAVEPCAFRWNGETELAFPSHGGRLQFVAAEQGGAGLSGDWLRAQALTLRYRSGGERLKLAPNRPTRSLKHHCQALDIPAWERETLIIVVHGNDVLMASGIGMDCHHFQDAGTRRMILHWLPDTP